MECHGWSIYFHRLFQAALNDLVSEVSRDKQKDPEGYKNKEAAKLLCRVYCVIFEEVPRNPSHPKYNAGTTFQKPYRDWKRAKPEQQYRLFFKFSSQHKRIIYAWLNDTATLRKYGSNSDAYKSFMKMLAAAKIPNDFKNLAEAASPPEPIEHYSDEI